MVYYITWAEFVAAHREMWIEPNSIDRWPPSSGPNTRTNPRRNGKKRWRGGSRSGTVSNMRTGCICKGDMTTRNLV